jgi:hypothetical protein
MTSLDKGISQRFSRCHPPTNEVIQKEDLTMRYHLLIASAIILRLGLTSWTMADGRDGHDRDFGL